MTLGRRPSGQRLVLALSGLFASAAVVLALTGIHLRPSGASVLAAQPVRTLGTLLGAGAPSLDGVAERALRAVVTVEPRRSARAEEPRIASGSGVLVGGELVLTNAHLVTGATDFDLATYDQRHLEAKLVGADPETDLAVLNIVGDTGGIVPLKFVDSSACKLGQLVLAVARRRGAESVTLGVISAKAASNGEAYEPFVRTDAALAAGAGGVVIDLAGQIVGIPVLMSADHDDGRVALGFALPSNAARTIMTSLIEHGHVEHGFLGVSVQDVDAALAAGLGLASSEGVLVADVDMRAPGVPGYLERGDVIRAINGYPTSSAREFRACIAAAKPGSTLELEIVRQGLRRSLELSVRTAPDQVAALVSPPPVVSNPRPLGLSLSALGRVERRRWSIPDSIRDGVVVDDVTSGTAAARAGLRAGDLVLELNRESVTSPTELARSWSDSRGGLLLLARRGAHVFYAAVEH